MEDREGEEQKRMKMKYDVSLHHDEFESLL